MIDEKRNKKREACEVEIFTVPLKSEEINNNTSIYSKTLDKASKEEIINQAFNFHSQGKILEASKYYQYLINQGYRDPRVYSNYGTILCGLGKFKEAELATRKAIELKPDFSDAYSNLGKTLIELGKLKEAELYTCKAIQMNPNLAETHYNFGKILNALSKSEEAEISTRKAIEIKPDFAEAHNNLGNILRDIGKTQEAELSIIKAIKINPNFAEAHSNLGTILKDLGKLREAEESQRKAINLSPNFAIAHLNLGSILKELDKLEEAEISTRKAIKINANLAEAHSNLGLILSGLGKLIEAEKSARKAIEIEPNIIETNYNLSLILLKAKKFREGWNQFEWRNKKKGVNNIIINKLEVSKPEWDKEAKGRVLLLGEQGIGDQILFASLINDLFNEVEQLIIQPDKRLIPIFKRSFDDRIIYSNQNYLLEGKYDFYISIGSLPKFFRNDTESFKRRQNKYLKVDANKTKILRNKYKTSNSKKIVGISWKSVSKINTHKSISLEELILGIYSSNICFINLQYGETKDEINNLKRKYNIDILDIDEVDTYNNIDDLSALINCCDDIVSIDNVTAILAGAIGSKCHLLLPYNSHWYWSINETSSYWLPSLMLYKQNEFKSWKKPLKAINEILKKT